MIADDRDVGRLEGAVDALNDGIKRLDSIIISLTDFDREQSEQCHARHAALDNRVTTMQTWVNVFKAAFLAILTGMIGLFFRSR